MKHLGFAAALLGMCCAVPAQAARFEANSPEAQTLMKAYFGNTLICKAEGIFECHNWMYPDGKFIQFSWDSRPNVMVDGVMLSGVNGLEGKWWLEGAAGKFQLCRQNAPTAKPMCQDEPQRKVGDQWDHPAHGNWPAEHFTLVEGRR